MERELYTLENSPSARRLQAMAQWYAVQVPDESQVGAWFLERPELSFEWYQSGRGEMFKARTAYSHAMNRVERLDLCLELLGIHEIRLWNELGWDWREFSLARFRRSGLTKDRCRTIARHLFISEDWLIYGHLPMLLYRM